MCNLCVFAGTTEGRELVEFLLEQGVQVTACTATAYGGTLLEQRKNLTIHTGRLDGPGMEALLRAEPFDCVIDATHPYAAQVTQTLRAACESTQTPYLRLDRGPDAQPEGALSASDPQAAVELLKNIPGPILLTTGSKDLPAWAALPDFAARVYARVLPLASSLEACRAADLPPAHILAMQGPFTAELNAALLRMTGATVLVTKQTGDPGGFWSKVQAAQETGALLLVVGRPPQPEGLTYTQTVAELCRRFALPTPKPKVALVGIGPGDPQSQTLRATRALREADCIIGAKRMLETASSPRQLRCEAVAPDQILQFIQAHPECRRFAVALSGDVGFFSGAKKLLPLLKDCTVEVIPGLSSLVSLCAKLGTSYEDVTPISLHGRPGDIAASLRCHRRLFALVGGENGVQTLCADLTSAGYATAQVSVGERLGYPDETITVGPAQTLAERHFHPLSAVLIEHESSHVVTPGLPDALFQRGGEATAPVPMTKSEVRAVALSKLALTADAVCWDIGAGTGSVSVEMALQASAGAVYAIERRQDALVLLAENKTRFHVPNLNIIPGAAPAVCADLPAPTHVFVGGSGGETKSILALALEKNPAVRIVAAAIALETVAQLTACAAELPLASTETVCLTVARDRQAGPYHLMTGQNPVYLFTFQGGGQS